MFVGLMHACDAFGGNDLPHKVAEKKTLYSDFGVKLARGCVANWLVCLAVWQTYAANDVIGKVVAVWFPVMAFVALGMEHSIANMFLLPLGWLEGGKLDVGEVVLNLVPATIGNVVGGTVGVAVPYWLVYGEGVEKVG